jgi:hypothetical protein
MQSLATVVRERVKHSMTMGLLAPAGALLDVARPRSRAFLKTPFNGQRGRRLLVDDVIRRVGCQLLVETGTFRGATTDYLTRTYPAQVISVEAAARFLFAARVRLRGRRNLRLIHADSRSGLRELARDPTLTRAPTFFYLDAHWGADLPLAEELRIISESWPTWVAVVDDFAVPDDPGYGFDDYGPGRTLNRAYLRSAGVPGLAEFWPKVRSSDEDGMARGCVVLTNQAEVAAKLHPSEHLRTIP